MKKCTKCNEVKPLTMFYKDRTTKDGYHPHCKLHKRKSAAPAIKAAYDREYRKRHVLRKKANMYKISTEKLAQLIAAQSGLCSICGCPETALHPVSKLPQALAIDHDHKTGKVRGLLCTNCNKGLGCFKDNVVRLKNAIIYLEQNS